MFETMAAQSGFPTSTTISWNVYVGDVYTVGVAVLVAICGLGVHRVWTRRRRLLRPLLLARRAGQPT